jgi:peptidoglycan/xylan/chitin deacetylase (PgdA/CDA1 family)
LNTFEAAGVPIPAGVTKAVCVSARFSGLSQAVAVRYRGRGVIFEMHSVVDDDADYLNDTLRCPATKLDQLLGWLTTQGVEFISMDQVAERLKGPPTRQFAAFTFDDGFADNLTRALPIMERHGAPFTVYVISGMITRQMDAWWLALDAWIQSRDRIDLPDFGRIECTDRASKKRTFKFIESAIQDDLDLLPQVWAAMQKCGFNFRTYVDQEALDEKQLRALAQQPLVTIGGHTTTHPKLKLLSAPEVEWEMATNRHFLQKITDQPIEHFAYPFGNSEACGEREAEIARSVGFRTAVTTQLGAIFPEHLDHPHGLPRVNLACNDTPSTLRCKMDGVYRAFQTWFGNPIAQM